jgi:ATPase subunit of ABC transporter with duplicated ATPase domains
MPMIFLPFVLSSCSDAYVALGRIGAFLTAEELGESYSVDAESKYAVQVDGDFSWEASLSEKEAATRAGSKNGKQQDKSKAGRGGKNQTPVLPTTSTSKEEENTDEQDEKPFELLGMKMKVPKGAFIAIVGRVGSGKSSLLQAMIGEMRKTRGEVHQAILQLVSCAYPERPVGHVWRGRGVCSTDRVDHERDAERKYSVWERGGRGQIPRNRESMFAHTGFDDASAWRHD